MNNKYVKNLIKVRWKFCLFKTKCIFAFVLTN